MSKLVNDEAFIERSYWEIFQRAPDPVGMSNYLRKLRSGIPRHQVLSELLASEEFGIRAASVPGHLLHNGTFEYLQKETQSGPASSISELLEFHDRRFLECAYRTLLNREADAEGVATYLRLLRSGGGKYKVIYALRYSPEGLRYNPRLPDLDFLLRRYRRTLLPVVGVIFSLVYRINCGGASAARARRIENLLYRIGHEIGVQSVDNRDLPFFVKQEISSSTTHIKPPEDEEGISALFARPACAATTTLRSLPSIDTRTKEPQ